MSAPRRALVVDDDAAIRILLTRIFTKHGFAVEAVRDGAEAIEKLIENDYAIVTLDLMMPRIDGFAVVKYVTEHLPEKIDKLIVVSAYGATAAEKVCPPVTRFMAKPFDIDKLLHEAKECGGTPQDGTASARV